MDEARLSEYQWAPEDERAMILSRFCDRSELLEIGEVLDLDWFDEKDRIGYNEADEAAAKIAAQITEPDQLEEQLSRIGVEKPSFNQRHKVTTRRAGRTNRAVQPQRARSPG
jgi:hypothetical protein